MNREREHRTEPAGEVVDLVLKVPPDMYRAFQRCVWILINDSGRDQLSVMEEVIRDFLVKHGC